MSIYKDIATRTGGDIYIGVVGPVRTGKSTFIKKFMETVVLPNIEDDYDKKRAQDEMPQSAAGRTVMTTEPKFIPDDAVKITLDGVGTLSVKMIDCVGYMIPEALGDTEDGAPRMVMTPWSPDPMPFEKAAETGTRKVVTDHSTIGLLVTSDGTFGDLPRESYIDAEARLASEMSALGKPYAIVLNSSDPSAPSSVDLAMELEKKYGAPVALVNCLRLDRDDIENILGLVLLEFPVTELNVSMPDYMNALDDGHPVRVSVLDAIGECASKVKKAGDVREYFESMTESEYIAGASVDDVDLGNGTASVTVHLRDGLLYQLIEETTGFSVSGDEELLRLLGELSVTKKQYDKVSDALRSVNETGYGIVTPDIYDMKLEEPVIVKKAGGYGVKLQASAPSIHMIKADIKTEVSPIVGTEAQSEELVGFLLKEFETDPKRIWDTNMFGKSLYELVNEGLNTKLSHIPDDARAKLSQTLARIVNEGSGGLLCIIL